MSDFEITRAECERTVSGMRRMPDSPAQFSVYCCKDLNICIKMNNKKFIVYYNIRKEYVGREDLLPVAFENEITLKIIK